MKERGILFSAPMVKAILADTKTQTRRIVRATASHVAEHHPDYGPYGMAGDRLWVRETWRMDQHGEGTNALYAADLSERFRGQKGPWRPSIFMPRALSRITLEVTAVRVERLQDITEEDARAEGVLDGAARATGCEALPLFRALWDHLNGKRAPWASSPWVWVVSFKRLP